MRFITGFCVAMLFASVANASPASDYLEKLDGKWRGGGVIETGRGEKKTRVRCSLDNDKQAGKLAIGGRCASSAGTRPLRGALTAKGSRISSGTVQLPGVGKLRNVSAKLTGKTLTLTGEVKQGGKAVPMRTSITPGAKTLNMLVQSRASGKWADRGILRFKR